MGLVKHLAHMYVFGYLYVAVLVHLTGLSYLSHIYRYTLIILALLIIVKRRAIIISFGFLLVCLSYFLRLTDVFIWNSTVSVYGQWRYFFDFLLWGVIFAVTITKIQSFSWGKPGIVLASLCLGYVILVGDSSYGSRMALYNLNPISLAFYASLTLYQIYFTTLKVSLKVLFGLVPVYVVLEASSRSNVIALVVVSSFILLKSPTFLRMNSRKMFLFMSALICAAYFFVSHAINFDTLATEKDLSAVSRIESYTFFLSFIRNHWLLGGGIVMPNGGYLHSAYLELIYATGIIGVIFVFMLLRRIKTIRNINLIQAYAIHALIIGVFSGIFPSILVPSFMLLKTNYEKE